MEKRSWLVFFASLRSFINMTVIEALFLYLFHGCSGRVDVLCKLISGKRNESVDV
jgi:hypothetical protein